MSLPLKVNDWKMLTLVGGKYWMLFYIHHFGGGVEFLRLSRNTRQIEAYNLPTALRKEMDRRSFSGLTTQVEALNPRSLAGIVRVAIDANMNLETLTAINEEAL